MIPFTPGLPPAVPPGPGYWFLFQDTRLLVQTLGPPAAVPVWNHPRELGLPVSETHFLGYLDGLPCQAGLLAPDAMLPPGTTLAELRHLAGRMPDRQFAAAAFGLHLTRWGSGHHFCSRCGGVLQDRRQERARECAACGWVVYPVMSPAVIVAVTRGDRLLLARARRFPGRMFSVLAGYVEPGESLEDCLRREVREEVGLAIRRLRYVASQPWAFSGALMVGFTAEYAGGRLQADGEEIVEAGWFAAGELPEIPAPFSLARRLIDDFVRRQQSRPARGTGLRPASAGAAARDP